jgi:hypothetical protein
MSAQGDRLSTFVGVDSRTECDLARKRKKKKADWNYRTSTTLGDAVNGGTAVVNTTPTAASCTDKLFVPVDNSASGTGPNVIAFTNLYTGCPEPPVPDPACTKNAFNHCPTKVWGTALGGALKGNSISLSLDMTIIYAVTTRGLVYKLDAATGNIIGSPFDARADTGASDATFTFSVLWLDYNTPFAYVAASYNSNQSSRLYKLDVSQPSITKAAAIDIVGSAGSPAGNSSGPIALNGFAYFNLFDGKIHKITTSTWAEAIDANWPVNPGAGKILDSASADITTNVMFVNAGDSLVMVRLGDGSFVTASIDGFPGSVNPNVSSPGLDLDNHSVYIGHERRLWRVDYDATANFTGSVLNPTSSPLVFKPTTTTFAFVGDFAGNLDQETITPTGFGAEAQFSNATRPPRPAMESPVLIDYVNGNLYFGDDSAFVYQISQVSLQ